ncbi:MAG: pyridoxal phosphate-dependent aminotransferase, partial [Prevotella sp.]|nr:pyridoxal phosphate-dependent aminotransferase [Prevotella sp.]
MYNYDEIIERRGSGCYKWDIDEAQGALPMWVADMDFRVAQPIIDALKRRVEHGIFGYTLVGDRYYNAIIDWFRRRHGWTIRREWIQYTTGVVPAVSVVIKALTEPGDKVLIQTPVYNCFFSSIRNNGCEMAETRLVQDGDSWRVDFDDMEQKAADPRVKLFLLCNPHNPVGRVWTRDELLKMNDICLRHGVKVIADEIHCELVMPGYRYTPFAAVSEECQNNSITCNSPSKSFNTAGLQVANIICNDEETRQRIDRAININEVCDVNPFGPEALIAAYNECEDWIDQLNEYLWGNYLLLKDVLAKSMPEAKVTRLEGTYLVWVDIRVTGLTSDEMTAHLLREHHILVNSGT